MLSRLTTPTAAQREALALMEQDGLPDGPDAYGLLYTLERDVPANEIGTVVDADIATAADGPVVWDADTLRAARDSGQHTWDLFEWRREAYPSLSPSDQDRALFCNAQ